MAGGSAGDDDVVVPVSPRAQQPSGGGRRGHRQKAAWLSLDIIIAEIASRSDPATLVRCAATCRDARRRIAEDPDLRGRLRLRDTERFVLPLLRGHLTRITTYTRGAFMSKSKTDVYLVDAAATTAADSTRLVKATFASGAEAETLSNVVPMDSRRGLFLVHATTTTQTNPYQYQLQLFVWNPATRRRLVLPPELAFPEDDPDAGRSTDVEYVLLVDDSDGEGAGAGADAADGRPFQVLKAKLVLSEKYRSHRRLLVQTFSSDHGAWSPCTEIPTPNLHGSDSSPSPLQRRPLVVGDVVHWLCLTDSGSYMLMLHVRAARVNVTALPVSFPRDGKNIQYDRRHQYLLAMATAGGNPVVLVADADRISAWEQSKHTKMWKPRPQVVIENETMLRFMRDKCVPRLELFGEKSGALLLRIDGCCLLWLDLHTKKILRCFSLDRLLYAEVYCPYEMDLSSWVPTFNSAVISFD
ncbi:unnamed protein product [Miscanthus lutarioriparius]|uniref:DUF7595 domain-containing protein n=1 Tax=Miscanthus lutarioriparius TaxID=422564 RepID=A0A811NBU4_9POAL|nr:unnamed protein product [Miscanthus lutarioriparius]